MSRTKHQKNIHTAEAFERNVPNPLISDIARVGLILVLGVTGAAVVVLGSNGWIGESRLAHEAPTRQLDEISQLRQQNRLLLAGLSEVEANLQG